MVFIITNCISQEKLNVEKEKHHIRPFMRRTWTKTPFVSGFHSLPSIPTRVITAFKSPENLSILLSLVYDHPGIWP